MNGQWVDLDSAETMKENEELCEQIRQDEKTGPWCDFCGLSSTLTLPLTMKACSRCKTARFCSVAHQKMYWKWHKSECVPAPPGTTTQPQRADDRVQVMFFAHDRAYQMAFVPPLRYQKMLERSQPSPMSVSVGIPGGIHVYRDVQHSKLHRTAALDNQYL